MKGCRHGFTLIELLMASALMAMLTLGLLGVITRMGVDPLSGSDVAVGDAVARARFDALERLWREELGLAETVRWGVDGSLELEGPLGLDSVTRARSYLPAKVRYRFEERGDRVWLVREQEGVEGSGLQDLVVVGLGRVVLEPVYREGTQMAGRAGPPVIELELRSAGSGMVMDERTSRDLAARYSAAAGWRVRMFGIDGESVVSDRLLVE